MINLYTLCYLCDDVVHVGSMRFDVKQGVQGAYALVWEGKQGVQGAYALVRGGSSTLNLIEPTRTTTSQR